MLKSRVRKKDASIQPFHVDFSSTAALDRVITKDTSADGLSRQDPRGGTRLYADDTGSQETGGGYINPAHASFLLLKQTIAEPRPQARSRLQK